MTKASFWDERNLLIKETNTENLIRPITSMHQQEFLRRTSVS
jgi:hypothetical protein